MSMRAPHATVVLVAKALSDETRLKLLLAVATRPEVSCADLVADFPLAQATVSHHLKVLVGAGLVSVRRAGQFHHYSIIPGALARWAGELIRTFAPARRALARKAPAGVRA